MDSTYIEKKAASERLFALLANSPAEETTPTRITPTVRRLAAQLEENAVPQYVPVIDDAYGLYGYCSDGVAEKINHDGGQIQYGWTIWEWPGILFTAEFHAVWVAPTGELIDITPKPMGEERILFVADPKYGADFDFDHRPPSRRINALESLNPNLYVDSRLAEMKPSQRKYEERRATKAGKTIEEWLASRVQVDPRVELIEQFIVVCDEVDRLTDAAPELSEGYAVADHALIAANLRKMELMNKIRPNKIRLRR